jgi:hypothetical protein
MRDVLPMRRTAPVEGGASLPDRAREDLGFIRRAMERSGRFTAVPGWGAVLMGLVGVAGSVAAAAAPDQDTWLAAWCVTGAVGAAVGAAATVRKARQRRIPLLTGPGRKALFGFLPPVAAALVLTVVLVQAGLPAALPGVWLLLYGTAVVTGGMYSVRPVPFMGLAFMACGALALLAPADFGEAWMACGFGGLHMGFGAWIARRHGG